MIQAVAKLDFYGKNWPYKSTLKVIVSRVNTRYVQTSIHLYLYIGRIRANLSDEIVSMWTSLVCVCVFVFVCICRKSLMEHANRMVFRLKARDATFDHSFLGSHLNSHVNNDRVLEMEKKLIHSK